MTLFTNVDASGVGMNDRQTGSLAATRRPNSLRCARFSRPAFSRSKVDNLRFAIRP
jgi:hypothetical protein